VDRPGPRKVHLTPIPMLGGLAIYIGVFLAIIITLRGPTHAQIVSILAGATLLAIIGILDDGGLLNHQVKLFIGMPGAALILLASGIHAQVFSTFLPDSRGTLLDGGLTVFWVVGITAAFSILDHMDGLCAGVAAVAAGFFMISASMNGQVMVRTLAAAALGAALGFLRWNFNPAKIFMGDGGAMFIGFLMAALGLKLRPEEAPSPASWLIPLFILGVPIFDTALVSISRARRGLVPFTSPGKDHGASPGQPGSQHPRSRCLDVCARRAFRWPRPAHPASLGCRRLLYGRGGCAAGAVCRLLSRTSPLRAPEETGEVALPHLRDALWRCAAPPGSFPGNSFRNQASGIYCTAERAISDGAM
jgi:UDP-N-acetylmuramyl pentapeptide phosphotransferase/UDP-N-acetylglucosamine-1-phosphate transferase